MTNLMNTDETADNLRTLRGAEHDVFAIRWVMAQRLPNSDRLKYERVLNDIIRNAQEALNTLKEAK